MENGALVTQGKSAMPASIFNREQVELIKTTVAKGATDDELQLFLMQCNRTSLDPFSKQIYFQKYKDKNGRENMTIITGIDGYRAIADRSGKYAGSDSPVFDNEQEPTMAHVTVYKIVGGQRCGFTATARWSEYYPGDSKGFMWKKMPHLMLGKCAEALALRKAFPNDLSGLYTKEEMEQAGEPINITPKQVSNGNPTPPAKTTGAATKNGFDPEDAKHREFVQNYLKSKAIPYSDEDLINVYEMLKGRPSTDIGAVVAELTGAS